MGVEIEYRLKFEDQISNICRKASQQINVLKRICIFFLNFDARKFIYHSFIMSNFDYWPLIWHFCSKGNTEKLEKTHFRALKFICQVFNSFYDILLEKAGTATLHLCRLRCLAIETFKIVYCLSPSYLREFVCLKDSSFNLGIQSKKISNDQKLIQSDPTSCPQNQKGNNQIHKLTAVYERHSR